MKIQYKLERVWEIVTDGIPNFFRNIWIFRKDLAKHRSWDYCYSLGVFKTSLIQLRKTMQNGNECRDSLNKKLIKMDRMIELLTHRIDETYIDQAEKELGPIILKEWNFEKAENGYSNLKDDETPEEKEHNKKVFARSREIDEEEMNEFLRIFKGQEDWMYQNNLDSLGLSRETSPWKEIEKADREFFDGSGISGWWY